MSALPPAPDENTFGLVWAAAEQKEATDRVLYVVEPVPVPCFVFTHCGELSRGDTRGKSLFLSDLVHDSETRLFQQAASTTKYSLAW